MIRMMTLAVATGLCATAAAQPKADDSKSVTVRFLGGVKKAPLEGLSVAL